MRLTNNILKIGLVVTSVDRLLLVKKRGAPSYILPGGKPEFGEDDIDALRREIREELGCEVDVDSVRYIETFNDSAADLPNKCVTVKVYIGRLVGEPVPRAEIERLRWYSPEIERTDDLAPSLRNSIVPYLSEL